MALIPDFPLPNNYFTGQAHLDKATPDGLAQILNYALGAGASQAVASSGGALVLDARGSAETLSNQYTTTLTEATEVDVSAMQDGDVWFLQATGVFALTVSTASGALNDATQTALYDGTKQNLIEFRKTSTGVWLTLLLGD
jgi:hypothetical protein